MNHQSKGLAAILAAQLACGSIAFSTEGSSLAKPAPSIQEGNPTASDLAGLHDYIQTAWSRLTRGSDNLAAAAVDPKFPEHKGRWPVYVSRREDLRVVRANLASLLSPAELERVDLRRLPRGATRVSGPGLLYLPYPYVVPGGRFNEMYGWDSYFIVRGLLRQHETVRAREMVDNAVYEVVNFGKVLNANRTYYLQRSQPPLLTAMIRAVFDVTHDTAWLASTLPAVRAQYRYWTTPPHLAGATGLSRYHALGSGPAPEVASGERDARGRSGYELVRASLRNEPAGDLHIAKFYDRRRNELTPLFYVADRSMRESGFDPTDRFGRFSLDILDYAPVCLNSLLFAMERDMATFLTRIGGVFEAPKWRQLAERRAKKIRNLLWDDRQGLFEDYDFITGERHSYPFATTFFPLWVGIATPEQARRLASAALALLMQPGGLETSRNASGKQWDAPFGWAPLQLVAVEGLRRYGMNKEANGIALAFLGTVLKEYVEHGKIFEKYDVVRRTADVPAGLRFGYASNEVGFGWTNGVFLELEAGLVGVGPADIFRAASVEPMAQRGASAGMNEVQGGFQGGEAPR